MHYKTNIAILIAGLTIVLSSCSQKNETQPVEVVAPVRVTVSEPVVNTEAGIVASGLIESAETAYISTRVMGYITKIYVTVGDRVREGQLLATISNDDMMARKAQADAQYTVAQAAFANAEKDYERFKTLHQQKSASDKELENITLQYNAAKAQAETARQMRNEVSAMIAYTKLTAPYSGTVTQKLADVGSIANPGMPLLVLDKMTDMHISASVTESEINKIKKGMPVQAVVKATGKQIAGKITEISLSSQLTGGQYQIEIDIPDSDRQGILSGMYVSVFIPLKEQGDVTGGNPLIPVSSVINRDQLTGIYTISDNQTALLRWVRLGKTIGEDVEVLSGLSGEEKFISKADGKLYNGAKVVVANEATVSATTGIN